MVAMGAAAASVVGMVVVEGMGEDEDLRYAPTVGWFANRVPQQ